MIDKETEDLSLMTMRPTLGDVQSMTATFADVQSMTVTLGEIQSKLNQLDALRIVLTNRST